MTRTLLLLRTLATVVLTGIVLAYWIQQTYRNGTSTADIAGLVLSAIMVVAAVALLWIRVKNKTTSLLVAALCLVASSANAALIYETIYGFWEAPYPPHPTTVTIGVGSRLGDTDPPLVETFSLIIPGPGTFDYALNEANAATFGLDWSLWESGFEASTLPKVVFEVAGRPAAHEVFADLDVIDAMQLRIVGQESSEQQRRGPIQSIRLVVDGHGNEPIVPEPTAFVLWGFGFAHLTWGRRGSTERR